MKKEDIADELAKINKSELSDQFVADLANKMYCFSDTLKVAKHFYNLALDHAAENAMIKLIPPDDENHEVLFSITPVVDGVRKIISVSEDSILNLKIKD